MATTDLISYYSSLLILQYSGKPKAVAMLKALVTPVIMDQLPLLVQGAYTLGTAQGIQLDVIGKYAGVGRNGYALNGSPITLSDSDFISLIQLAIIKNKSDGSLYNIQNLLSLYFPGTILVFDYQNMQMNYFFNSSIGSQSLAQVFVSSGLLPRPLGVQLGSAIYAATINNFFGFRTYQLPGYNVVPFNAYTSYSLLSPWLSYSNAVTK